MAHCRQALPVGQHVSTSPPPPPPPGAGGDKPGPGRGCVGEAGSTGQGAAAPGLSLGQVCAWEGTVSGLRLCRAPRVAIGGRGRALEGREHDGLTAERALAVGALPPEEGPAGQPAAPGAAGGGAQVSGAAGKGWAAGARRVSVLRLLPVMVELRAVETCIPLAS